VCITLFFSFLDFVLIVVAGSWREVSRFFLGMADIDLLSSNIEGVFAIIAQ
jgi:hypothetical protein